MGDLSVILSIAAGGITVLSVVVGTLWRVSTWVTRAEAGQAALAERIKHLEESMNDHEDVTLGRFRKTYDKHDSLIAKVDGLIQSVARLSATFDVEIRHLKDRP